MHMKEINLSFGVHLFAYVGRQHRQKIRNLNIEFTHGIHEKVIGKKGRMSKVWNLPSIPE